jgi:hypothetical protein
MSQSFYFEMTNDHVAIIICLGAFAMITLISITKIVFGKKSSQYTDAHPQDTNLHPLHKFRSFDERIRKIEERIQNLEILIGPEDDSKKSS